MDIEKINQEEMGSKRKIKKLKDKEYFIEQDKVPLEIPDWLLSK